MGIIFCSVENCQNSSRQGGLCATHYSQRKYEYTARTERIEPFQVCAVSHCDLPANSRLQGAMCNPHYQKKYRGLNPEDYRIPINHPARNAPVCRFPNCQKHAHVKEMCNYHYNRILKGRILDPEGKVVANGACSFPECVHAVAQKGLCQSHYEQKRLKGEMTPIREFGVYTEGSTPCLLKSCKKPAISQYLCGPHFRQVKKYGLTVEELDLLWSNPSCSNPGCSNTTRLHIDHDHGSGRVRGLLCNGCNTSLGHLKEDIDRILGLAEYKRLHS